MFERFSDQARRTVVLAQEESRRLGHRVVGAPHLLLGGLSLGDPLPHGDLVRTALIEALGPGQTQPDGGHIPFTPGAKASLERALRTVDGEHREEITRHDLLLALLDQPEVAEPLEAVLDLDALRAAVAAARVTPERSTNGDTEVLRLLREIVRRLDAIEARLDH